MPVSVEERTLLRVALVIVDERPLQMGERVIVIIVLGLDGGGRTPPAGMDSCHRALGVRAHWRSNVWLGGGGGGGTTDLAGF